MTDLSKDGDTLGLPVFVPSNKKTYLHNQRLGKVIIKSPDIDSRYLYYLMSSKKYRDEILSTATGSTVKHTAPNRIESFKFQLPPLSEQKRIAHILGSLDDKIELNRKMNETLEQMARAIFKSWFVDFDPVHAKAAGKKPFGMDDATAALFPDSFEESELGLIPKGWRVKMLGEIVENYDSKRIPLSGREREKKKGGYPYYGAASQTDSIDEYLFDGTYILVGEDGSVINKDGSPVVQYVWGKFWVNNHAHVLKGRGISEEHLLLQLREINISPYITGAVQLKLNQSNMNTVPIISATHDINSTYSNRLKTIYELVRSNIEELQYLDRTKSFLLSHILSEKSNTRSIN